LNEDIVMIYFYLLPIQLCFKEYFNA